MKRKGFSFACPTLVNDKDEAFQRFLKAAIEEPNKIYNAFPQIADPANFNLAQTQPLVGLVYLPTTKLDSVPYNSIFDFKLLINYLHEMAHKRFDSTPAKLLARLVLSNVYFSLDALFTGESWNARIWGRSVDLNTQLSAICNAITLSEELIAIAHSFKIITGSGI